ncbi:MAG TPA: F0F1 ATP synthase subunit delta [Terrimicrobiaceae bacterium]|nr:F0F1 ATP synthase subunit delta [Terrimicrobiaceae bacterium]
MKISREARRLARELFRLSLVDGRLDAGRVSEIADRILAEKPRGFLHVFKEFSRLVRLELDRRHAVIESASPLDEANTANIANTLKEKFGGDITTEFRTSPGLLGGLRIKLGSDVWDGSISSRLAALSQQL